MTVERASDRSPLCPRCGGRLRRERRRFVHRLMSMVYPMRAYACSTDCGWHGVLGSSTALKRRKRQVRWALVVVALGLVSGLALWKYRADLIWSPAPPAVDGEEVGAAQ